MWVFSNKLPAKQQSACSIKKIMFELFVISQDIIALIMVTRVTLKAKETQMPVWNVGRLLDAFI